MYRGWVFLVTMGISLAHINGFKYLGARSLMIFKREKVKLIINPNFFTYNKDTKYEHI